jgi:Zn-dependent peptidase ImmA (M78 family)
MYSKAIDIKSIFRPFTVIRDRQVAYPVAVEKLAGDFGITIIRKDWPDTFSGAIGKDAKGYFIIVNNNNSDVRQRFTIAHQISHYILHRNRIDVGGIKDSWMYHSHLSDEEESAANHLALSILMPVDLVGRAASENGLLLTPKDLPRLANVLNVSLVSLSTRLGNAA